MSSNDPLHTSLCLSIDPARVRGGILAFGDNISPSEIASRMTFFLSVLLVFDGDNFGILYVGECDCRPYGMLGPGYIVTGCSLYGLSLKSLENPRKGKTGGFSRLGERLGPDGWRGGNQAAEVSGGRAPCCSDAKRCCETGGCCN